MDGTHREVLALKEMLNYISQKIEHPKVTSKKRHKRSVEGRSIVISRRV